MRVLWTLLKVIIGLAIAIPVAFLALALTAGLVGTLIALAVIALKLGHRRRHRVRTVPARARGARAVTQRPRPHPFVRCPRRVPGSVLRGGRARARRGARRSTARLN